MKSLLICLAASAALLGAPALAQDHTDHHPATDAAATPKPMSEMNDAELHAHCKAMMGDKMDDKAVHHQARDKASFGPHKMALSKAEMADMHKKCTAIMGDAAAHLKAK